MDHTPSDSGLEEKPVASCVTEGLGQNGRGERGEERAQTDGKGRGSAGREAIDHVME